MTTKQLNKIYWRAEAVFSAIDKCHLRQEHRADVDRQISNFRRAVIALGKKKDPRKKPRRSEIVKTESK